MKAFALHLNEQTSHLNPCGIFTLICKKKKKKSVDGAAINGGSVKSEGSVTHEKP